MLSESCTIRVRFNKIGNLQFISHLDLCRTMRSSLKRAGIPVMYSEGFNPHPKMSFLLPLSIGCQSVCEVMELKIASGLSFDEIKDRLNSALTDELVITEVYSPVNKYGDLGFAEYIVTFDAGFDTVPLSGQKLVVSKRTKNGERNVDILPLIKKYECSSDSIKLLLSADSENYLNPEYVVKAITSDGYDIMRTNVYLKDGVTFFR